MEITKELTLQDLFNYACKSFGDVKTGEEFLEKDLFRGFEWSRIPKGNRTKLGSMFFNYVLNEAEAQIQPIGKTPQNQQKYQKK